MKLSVSVPENISDKLHISKVYGNYTATGKLSSYGVTLKVDELNLHREIKSREFELLAPKIENALRQWEEAYDKHLKKVAIEATEAAVSQKNAESAKHLKALETILAHTLHVDDRIDWNSLKRKDEYRVHPEELIESQDALSYLEFDKLGRPTGCRIKSNPPEPTFEETRKANSLFKKIFMTKMIREDFESQHDTWKKECAEVEKENSERDTMLAKALSTWQKNKEAFDRAKTAENEKIDTLRSRYKTSDPGAVEEYCDMVLSHSQYPDGFPKDWLLEYKQNSRMIVLEYELPEPSSIPDVESYKFVKSRNEVQEKKIPESKRKELFNSVIYQVCIRTMHELFEADVIDAIDAIGFNGIVTTLNPATGIRERKLIMSVTANKKEFMAFDLSNVSPKATFKHLKGVSAANLMDLTPVPPVVQLDKSDQRFIEGRELIHTLNDSVNLAAMPWDDFEHLIREIFEKEFVSNGGEVKVTQASSDGGVDAVAFDPDPIRGGKIVIQAKRYTNTVGVAAVRDLYGTVMNEGATKGILVTTSDYGSDSYNFAKDKPITLLNGGNLLALLDKHGHNARINLGEAKKINTL